MLLFLSELIHYLCCFLLGFFYGLVYFLCFYSSLMPCIGFRFIDYGFCLCSFYWFNVIRYMSSSWYLEKDEKCLDLQTDLVNMDHHKRNLVVLA